MVIKSEALANFIAEWMKIQTPAITEKLEYWTMYFDGSLMIEGAGAGIVLISPTNERLKYVLQIHFPVSNNAAEYEALLHGLRIAISLGIRRFRKSTRATAQKCQPSSERVLVQQHKNVSLLTGGQEIGG